MLWVMHIYWFSMFVRMVTKAIKKGDTEDRQNDTQKTLARDSQKDKSVEMKDTNTP